MAYEQAQIPVQKVEEFQELRSAIERIFSTDALTSFYGELQNKDIGARQFERILELGLLDAADKTLADRGKKARDIYGSLSQTDQAMMREFYLERMERVDPSLRQKYRRVYEYR